MAADFRPSPLAVAVLTILMPGPLHPYGIQRLIRHWHKDTVVNVSQRATLYKTINRLREEGLIRARQTERDQQYPERTVYEVTDRGRQLATASLADMMATVRNEYPQFPVSLSLAMALPPEEVLAALEQRAAALRGQLAGFEQTLKEVGDVVPRVALLDDEHQRAVLSAELSWVESVLSDLRSGALTWDAEMLASAARADLAPLAADLTPEYGSDLLEGRS